MNMQNEIIEESKKKLRNRLMDLKFLLERKATTLDTQIDDLENGIDVEFYYQLIEHINNSILIQGRKTQEYLLLMVKQIKALEPSNDKKDKKPEENDSQGTTEKSNTPQKKDNEKNMPEIDMSNIDEDL